MDGWQIIVVGFYGGQFLHVPGYPQPNKDAYVPVIPYEGIWSWTDVLVKFVFSNQFHFMHEHLLWFVCLAMIRVIACDRQHLADDASMSLSTARGSGETFYQTLVKLKYVFEDNIEDQVGLPDQSSFCSPGPLP